MQRTPGAIQKLFETEIDAARSTMQMGTHRLARIDRVAARNGISQTDMLRDRHLHDLLQHGAGSGRIDRQADALGYEADEQGEVLVVGGLCHGAMESEIGHDPLLRPFLRTRHLRKSLIDPGEIGRRMVHSGKASRFDLQGHAELEKSPEALRLGERVLFDADRPPGRLATNAPTPWRVSTSPSLRSCAIASRTTDRLTPSVFASTCSVGRRSPGFSRP